MTLHLPLRATLVAGAAATLLAGGLLSSAAASHNECHERGQESTPVVTDAIHQNEETLDVVLGPLGRDAHEDVEPLTCLP